VFLSNRMSLNVHNYHQTNNNNNNNTSRNSNNNNNNNNSNSNGNGNVSEHHEAIKPQSPRTNRRKSVMLKIHDAIVGNEHASNPLSSQKPLSLVEQYYLEEERREREEREKRKSMEPANNGTVNKSEQRISGVSVSVLDSLQSLDALHMLIAEVDEEEKRKSLRQSVDEDLIGKLLELGTSSSANQQTPNDNRRRSKRSTATTPTTPTAEPMTAPTVTETENKKEKQLVEDLMLSDDEDGDENRRKGDADEEKHKDDNVESDEITDLSDDEEDHVVRGGNRTSTTLNKLLHLKRQSHNHSTNKTTLETTETETTTLDATAN